MKLDLSKALGVEVIKIEEVPDDGKKTHFEDAAGHTVYPDEVSGGYCVWWDDNRIGPYSDVEFDVYNTIGDPSNEIAFEVNDAET
jgi:hypothetical protein